MNQLSPIFKQRVTVCLFAFEQWTNWRVEYVPTGYKSIRILRMWPENKPLDKLGAGALTDTQYAAVEKGVKKALDTSSHKFKEYRNV